MRIPNIEDEGIHRNPDDDFMHVGRKRFWLAAFLGILLLVYTIDRANLPLLLQHMTDIDPVWTAAVLGASILSYLCIGAVLYELLDKMGNALDYLTVFRISLVSCTLNYLMAMGGLSGVAAKVYMLAQKKIPPSRTLSISMVHGFLTNTVAVLLIYLGFFYLYSGAKMNARDMGVAVAVLVAALALTWVTIQVIVSSRFRKRLWNLLLNTAVSFCHRVGRPYWINVDRSKAFFENFDDSMNLLVSNVKRLGFPALYATLDWFFMFLSLKCSFLAVRYPVSTKVVLVGFSVGIFAALFSVTPASLGIMEGSMAGSFYLLGLDYERALLATLIYRIAYFLLPLVTSAFFFREFYPRKTPRGSNEIKDLSHGNDEK